VTLVGEEGRRMAGAREKEWERRRMEEQRMDQRKKGERGWEDGEGGKSKGDGRQEARRQRGRSEEVKKEG
jgi:hypothetical protein